MTRPQVQCTVSSCSHWVPGDLCNADVIDVLDERSRSPGSTQCHTFVARANVAGTIGALGNVDYTGTVAEPFAPGQQLSPRVACVAQQCTYWGEGNACHAERIRITGAQARHCEDTDCATFALKA